MAALLAQADAEVLPTRLWHRDLDPDVQKELQRVLEDTGEGQLAIVQAASTPASPWLDALWAEARGSRREDIHRALAESVFDLLTDDPDHELADADIEFLGATGLSAESPSWEAVSALRLLATLAEDDYGPRVFLVQPLIAALQLGDPARRLAAVEGLWQCDATVSIPALEELAEVEQEAAIQATIEHALRILRGLVGGGG